MALQTPDQNTTAMLWQTLDETGPPLLTDDARRLFHGRGHCYEGLTFLSIDWYRPVILVTLFLEPEEAWLTSLVEGLHERPGWSEVTCVVVQRRYARGAPSTIAWGELPSSCYAIEDEQRYNIALGAQQNIGFFLDMRNGRRWLQAHAANKRVLNLFAFTCAFSVVAIAHGAKDVTNLDMSRSALATGKTNHEANDLDLRRAHYWGYDLFRSWGRLRKYGPYDIVIIDPPTSQRGSFVADKDYQKVARRVGELLAPKAQVLACLNAPHLDFAFLRDTFANQAPALIETETIPTPEDFPEASPNKGLKTLIYQKQG